MTYGTIIIISLNGKECLISGTMSDGYRYSLLDEYLTKKDWSLSATDLMKSIQAVVHSRYPIVSFKHCNNAPKQFDQKNCEVFGDFALEEAMKVNNKFGELGSNVTTIVDMRTQTIHSPWFADDWRYDIDKKLSYFLLDLKRKQTA